MTKTITRALPSIITCKGKGKSEREMAFVSIAPFSFVEDTSRSQSINNLRVAFGKDPTEKEIAVGKQEWTIGRVASRLPVGELPKDCVASIDKLEYARKLVTLYAAPAKDGAKSRALRSGQVGRRSIIQHRVIRNAEEAWSLVAAELAIGGARTMAEKNAKQKATRAPQMAGSSKDGAKPSHSELVKPAAPVTVEEARAGMLALATTALAYANKHGKLLASDYGKAAHAFKTAIIAAEKADVEARGAAEAKAAELVK